ncbi:hypothetical protein ACFCXG_30535, partial [Streptomyces sp. NPDC056295]|uniref:hypothetical protein n=2 Tax=unclassified Streptomyces TaxID=2593676 RepID=UPI0035E19480
MCRLPGFLCLLGELHRDGTPALRLPPCRVGIVGLGLGTLAGLALLLDRAAGLGELLAQGVRLDLCRTPGLGKLPPKRAGFLAGLVCLVLCLLGELHRDGTPALRLPPCRVGIVGLGLGTLAGLALLLDRAAGLGELLAQGVRLDLCRTPGLGKLPPKRAGFLAGLVCLVLCLLGELHRDGTPALRLPPC